MGIWLYIYVYTKIHTKTDYRFADARVSRKQDTSQTSDVNEDRFAWVTMPWFLPSFLFLRTHVHVHW